MMLINANLDQLKDLKEAINARCEAGSSFGSPSASSDNHAQDKGGLGGKPCGRAQDKLFNHPPSGKFTDEDMGGVRKKISYPLNPPLGPTK